MKNRIMKVICCSILVLLVLNYTKANETAFEIDPEETGGNFEGDMILNDDQLDAVLNSRSRNIRVGTTWKWKNATVFYQIGKAFNQQQTELILKAMSEIEKVSCIRFLPKTPINKNYIKITGMPTGCHSAVGRQKGEQKLNLAPNYIGQGCFKLFKIVHEFIHALGFFHQHSSSDRDDFVKILKQNIKEGKMSNFIKYDEGVVTDFGVGYDYSSVMHYGSSFFSKNGQPTMIALKQGIEFGQREKLSQKDIIKLNLMYCSKNNI